MTNHSYNPTALEQENEYLKYTIIALRSELEKNSIMYEENKQQAVAIANKQITDLKDSVSKLREQLERNQIQFEEDIQKAIAQKESEIKGFKGSVSTLRDQLEQNQAEHEQNKQYERNTGKQIASQLQDTIIILRKKLDEVNNGNRKEN